MRWSNSHDREQSRPARRVQGRVLMTEDVGEDRRAALIAALRSGNELTGGGGMYGEIADEVIRQRPPRHRRRGEATGGLG